MVINNYPVMNKKGIELIGNKVIGIIIAVLCIVGLIYFASILIKNNEENQNRNRANGLMDEIVTAMSNIKQTEECKKIIISTLTDWNIYTSYNNQEKPLSCDNKECLCLCPKVGIKEQAASCYNQGICRTIPNVMLKNDQGEPARTMEISAPIEGAKEYASEITITKKEQNYYEISYSKTNPECGKINNQVQEGIAMP